MKKFAKQTLVALSLAISIPAFAASYTIGTGSQSGTYYPLVGITSQNLE